LIAQGGEKTMTKPDGLTTARHLVMAAFMAAALAGVIACERPVPETAQDGSGRAAARTWEPGKAAPVADATDGPALHAAARAGDLAEVRRLIEVAHVPVDAGDRYDASALMMAADRGHLEVVLYLLDAGADVNHREVFFNTSAFDNAVWRERSEVAAALLGAGSDQREDAVELAVSQNMPDLARAAVAAGPLYESTIQELQGANDLGPEIRKILEGARTRPDPEPPVYTPQELAQFEGSFETWDAGSGKDIGAKVTVEDGSLRLVLEGGDPVGLAASGDWEFKSGDGSLEASFWGRLGTVESLTVSLRGAPPVRMRHSIGEPLGAGAISSETTEKVAAAVAGESEQVNWPQFRGADAGGVGDGRTVPATWDLEAGTGVRWQAILPGLGNSSPIVWQDRVIITTAVAEGIEQNIRTGLTGAGDPVDESVEHTWRVLAFEKTGGKLLWDTEVGRGVPLTRRHFKATQANSSPATDGRHVVVVFPTGGFACLGLDGEVHWKHDLGGLNASSPNDPGTEWGFASSPVIYNDRVILQVDTYEDPHIAAWDLETGRQLWRTARDVPPSWATPVVMRSSGGDELIVNGATIFGYDPASGEELWRLGPNSELVIATPVVGDGVVYVSAGYAPITPIYAVRQGTRGQFQLEPGTDHEQLAWSHERGGAYMPTPLLYGGLLYLVHHNGRMVVYDAATGAVVYKTRFSKGGTFTASPVAASGKLYISTEEGQVYVIEAGATYREIAVNEMGEPVMATPAFSEGTMFIRTTRRLAAIGS
jgi:outer membrane protein assembly factor BamB